MKTSRTFKKYADPKTVVISAAFKKPIEKVPHSVCAIFTLKIARKELMKYPKSKWSKIIERFERSLERKWARSLTDGKAG